MLMWLLAGCAGLKVQNDCDPQYDFSKVRRFAIVYVQNEDGAVSLARAKRCRAIREILTGKGYEITGREQAELLVVFHLDVTRRRQIVTDYEMVGLYPYYPGYWGGMVPVTREYTWNEAKIVVDIVDPADNRVVWRSLAVDRLNHFETPQERMAYARKVVAKMFADFPPEKRVGNGK